MTKAPLSLLLFIVLSPLAVTSLAPPQPSCHHGTNTRRTWLVNLGHAAAFLATTPSPGLAMESLDVDAYLKTGGVSMPMGVSGQGGKMRPTTGVVLRDGSQVARDARNGNVLAELVLQGNKDLVPVLATFSSPWPLGKTTSNLQMHFTPVTVFWVSFVGDCIVSLYMTHCSDFSLSLDI
jgi:hypothetical protein